ncbi:MAG: hypothetical protein HQM00_14100 [Magnetococcales bacterium]|nr:hypothetical protein [Magnetococcales bacterium]
MKRELLIPDRPLPESYMGYSPEELLNLLDQINNPPPGEYGAPKTTPLEKVIAMRRLLLEYRMTPELKWPPGEREIEPPHFRNR